MGQYNIQHKTQYAILNNKSYCFFKSSDIMVYDYTINLQWNCCGIQWLGVSICVPINSMFSNNWLRLISRAYMLEIYICYRLKLNWQSKLFSLYVLFSQKRSQGNLTLCFFRNYAHICTRIIRNLKETVLWVLSHDIHWENKTYNLKTSIEPQHIYWMDTTFSEL